MKFIDEARITVQSGNGGAGCVSFRREKYVSRGGPDGGDGGKGGNIVFATTPRKRTLLDFQYKKHFRAENGRPGKGKQQTGRNGKDHVIEIPAGTILSDAETGEIIKDFTRTDESMIIAAGGRGGQGNMRFATSTHQAPRFSQQGQPGESLSLSLELKLLADVGIIGFPNVGKSTLVSSVSAARPKIGDYPFTTLVPTLGVVRPVRGEPFVMADIPGLIEGAHKGAGLGIQFLRHIERTRILIHLMDATAIDPDKPLAIYKTINRELEKYSRKLAKKPQIVALNKMDLPESEEPAEKFRKAAKQMAVISISASTGMGIDELIAHTVDVLDNHHELPSSF